MTDPILSFTGEYRWLSNFYESSFFYDGRVVPTVEHAYQAAKARTEVDRAWVLAAATPGQAKRRGRQIELRENWETVKIGIMHYLLVSKFGYNAVIKAKLLATEDAYLQEGNDWGDTFWGVTSDVGGANHLGRLLMFVRDTYRITG